MELGDNLSRYPNLTVLKSDSAEGLNEILLQIRLPYNIINIYEGGGFHYAWINSYRKLKIVNKKVEQKAEHGDT